MVILPPSLTLTQSPTSCFLTLLPRPFIVLVFVLGLDGLLMLYSVKSLNNGHRKTSVWDVLSTGVLGKLDFTSEGG